MFAFNSRRGSCTPCKSTTPSRWSERLAHRSPLRLVRQANQTNEITAAVLPKSACILTQRVGNGSNSVRDPQKQKQKHDHPSRPPLHPFSKHPTISPIGSPTSRPQTLAALSMVHAAWATSHDRTAQNHYYKSTTLGSHPARKEVGAWLSKPRSTRSTPSCALAQMICINNNDDGPWASRCWLCAGRDRASPASLPTRATWRYTIRLKGANASSKGGVVAAGALQAFVCANVPL